MRTKGKHFSKAVIACAVMVCLTAAIILYLHFGTHKPGEPLEHEDFLEGWELDYGSSGGTPAVTYYAYVDSDSVHVPAGWYDLEELLFFFPVLF